MPPQLTNDEIEKMRALVADQDARSGGNVPKEFDINNPPRAPYVHQDFPRVVYHHKKRVHKTVQNEEELAEAVKLGFQKEGFPPVVEQPDDDEPEPAEKPTKGRK